MTGHIIHIGFPKTGSNFLRRWFANHPQLAYADGGIAGFNDVYQIARDSAQPRPGILYRVTSSEGLATPHVYAGLDTIDYHHMRTMPMPEAQSNACATLASVFPNAHILMVTRGFRAVWYSGYSQYVRTGGDADFADLLANAFHLQRDGLHSFDYDFLIRTYTEAFGERLLVMPYELLQHDAEAFTGHLEKHFGLQHCPAPLERLNKSLSSIELAWYPRLTRLVHHLPLARPLRTLASRIYGQYLLTNRLARFIKLLQRVRTASPITADLISDEILDLFRGKADLLRDNPLYAAYAREYLFD